MTIWLDVTTTLGWGRPALGIVRVEAETARHFLNSSVPSIRFCRFDRVHGVYFEVVEEEISAALARLDAGGAGIPPATIAKSVPISIDGEPGEQGKKRLLGLLDYFPSYCRDRMFRFALSGRNAFHGFVCTYRVARAAAAVMRRGQHRGHEVLRSSSEAPAALSPVASLPFAAEDVYVSLGLDWDQKDLVYLYELKRRFGLKVLLFCYDIIPIRLPHLCVAEVAAKFPRYFVDVARCADTILCISEHSRRDLSQFLETTGEPVPALGVIRLGCDIATVCGAPPSDVVAKVLERPFILFVSTIERRKNHDTLYRAYTRLVDAGQVDLPLLVFVGMLGWGIGDLLSDLRLDPRIQPYFCILDHVSDNELARLYQSAYFTVYPSLYEGWGLPVAESLAYGKFCLASNAASIPEVGGDLIEYIDPWDVPRWAERLMWYINHPIEIKRREANIRSRYRSTDWQETGGAIVATALSLTMKHDASGVKNRSGNQSIS